MTEAFVHLRVHSEFSVADGLVKINALTQACQKFSQPAVAITDISNLYGTIKFYKACLSQGIKPVIGADVWLQNPLQSQNADRVLLLCMNNQGYQYLSKLLTEAYLQGAVNGRIQVRWDDFRKYNQGVICIFDEHEGPLNNALAQQSAYDVDDIIRAYNDLLKDRLYFSVSRIGWPGEQQYINHAISIGVRTGVPLVATNRVQFIHERDFDAHEIRVCINDGRVLEDSRRPRKHTEQQYLRSTEEMQDLFSDMPCVLTNTVTIARRCNVFFDFEKKHLPEYPNVDDLPVAQVLRNLAEEGLENRRQYASIHKENDSPIVWQEYIDRLNFELDVIQSRGFSGYFLIVADFIRWARENDIPVGPGRGSGAGSLVAWATGITELDPLSYGLLFERFLNPERASLPDFDIDFCVDGRDRVIDYVAERYGHDKVAQIITFGTMAAKAAVRDVGRVMGFPYGFVDQIAKLIPFVVGMTLQEALEQENVLAEKYNNEDDVRELIDSALQLEGTARNVGKHAGGVVIAPKALTEYVPLYADAHLAQAITQFDKDDLETIGLVKFDFLGLRTLTILYNALKMVNAQKTASEKIDLATISLDDQITYKFIQTGRTSAIFQLESRGMKDLIVRSRPDVFEDLIALIAIYRPGPLQSGMVEDFINRKNGLEPVQYLHPLLEPILKSTNGVILYQEQVMEIARSMAGYTLADADLLRKAMSKKDAREMMKQRVRFVDGSVSNGIEEKRADEIFSIMDKFAGYGFNKSHSAAYALISYQTAWMKAHYPAAYMAATLSAEIDNTDKVVTMLADCKLFDIKVSAPNINTSFYTFKPMSQDEISYGLGALKGVGEGVIQGIVDEREENGHYQNLYDLCNRNDVRKVNKRVLQALVKSGALDDFTTNRAQLMADIADSMQAAGQQQQNVASGQFDLFGLGHALSEKTITRQVDDWPELVRLNAEKDTLGLYLTGHPYNQYAAELNLLFEPDVTQIDLSTPKPGMFAGTMLNIRVLNTRRGKMGVMTLDNGVHRVEVSLFSEKLNLYFSKLVKDRVLIVMGELSVDEYSGSCQIRAELVFQVEELRGRALDRIIIKLSEKRLSKKALNELVEILQTDQNSRTSLTVHYEKSSGEQGLVDLGQNWKINPTQQIIDKLSAFCGEQNIRFQYNIRPFFDEMAKKPKYRPRVVVNQQR